MKRFNFALASAAAGAAITLCAFAFAHKTQAAKPDAAKPSAAKPSAAKSSAARPLNVAFVVYDNVEGLDLIGPMDVFVVANGIQPSSYNVYTVGVEDGLISAERGAFSIQPGYTLANCPAPDILVVPGTGGKALEAIAANRPFTQWLAQKGAEARVVLSICNGAFPVGQAGLLDNRKSTAHWSYLNSLQAQFPKTTVMQGMRVVEDGKLVTTAGVTNGIDGAFHVVEKISGRQTADSVARVMQYRRGTPAFPDQKPGKLVPARAEKSAAQAGGRKLASNTDPVCGMDIGAQTKLTHEHKGRLYGFCAAHCRDTFTARPEPYLKSARQPH